MKITLDKEKCIGCGSCVAVCPDFFEMDQDSKARLKEGKALGQKEETEIEEIGCAGEAADICGVQAIEVKE